MKERGKIHKKVTSLQQSFYNGLPRIIKMMQNMSCNMRTLKHNHTCTHAHTYYHTHKHQHDTITFSRSNISYTILLKQTRIP